MNLLASCPGPSGPRTRQPGRKGGPGSRFPVTITREEIKTLSVKGKVMEPGYGWIRLSQFQERTVEDFVRKVDEIYKAVPDLAGIVLKADSEGRVFAVTMPLVATNWFAYGVVNASP